MMPALAYQLADCLKTFVCRLLKRLQVQGAHSSVRRRTLQYVEARWAKRNEVYEAFQQPGKEKISQLIWIRLAGIVDQ
jgi:hypothetical protein